MSSGQDSVIVMILIVAIFGAEMLPNCQWLFAFKNISWIFRDFSVAMLTNAFSNGYGESSSWHFLPRRQIQKIQNRATDTDILVNMPSNTYKHAFFIYCKCWIEGSLLTDGIPDRTLVYFIFKCTIWVFIFCSWIETAFLLKIQKVPFFGTPCTTGCRKAAQFNWSPL